MRLYLVAAGAYDVLEGIDGMRWLLPYNDLRQSERRMQEVDRAERCGIPLFLDSGAYTAHTRGTRIELDEYHGFVREHGHRFEAVAALDVIGDGEASWRNYERTRDAGLPGIPTFHLRDDERWLTPMLEEAEYIALGGMAGGARKHRLLMAWCTRMFKLIGEAEQRRGVPIRVHGFGVTWSTLMAAFPWYSVDSSTWMAGTRWGRAIVWEHRRIRQVTRWQVAHNPTLARQVIGEVSPPPAEGRADRGAHARAMRTCADRFLRWVDELNAWREGLSPEPRSEPDGE